MSGRPALMRPAIWRENTASVRAETVLVAPGSLMSRLSPVLDLSVTSRGVSPCALSLPVTADSLAASIVPFTTDPPRGSTAR